MTKYEAKKKQWTMTMIDTIIMVENTKMLLREIWRCITKG